MSRRKRNIIIAASLLLAAVVICLDHGVSRKQPYPPSKEPGKAQDFTKYYGKSFLVVNVVDGDTIDIDIPDGQKNHTRIRLWGVDTPETKNPKTPVMYFGPEAAEFTTKLTLGKQVNIYLDEANQTRGKFGRLLAYVRLPDGRFLNEVLISDGFAYVDLHFRHSFYYKYISLEKQAYKADKGLWKDIRREQLPDWLKREKPRLLLDR